MLVAGVESEASQDIGSGSLEIDEASPDEDEHFAMSVLCGQHKCQQSSH